MPKFSYIYIHFITYTRSFAFVYIHTLWSNPSLNFKDLNLILLPYLRQQCLHLSTIYLLRRGEAWWWWRNRTQIWDNSEFKLFSIPTRFEAEMELFEATKSTSSTAISKLNSSSRYWSLAVCLISTKPKEQESTFSYHKWSQPPNSSPISKVHV